MSVRKVDNAKWVNEKGKTLLTRDGDMYSFPVLLQTFEELTDIAMAVQHAIKEGAGK